MSRAKSCASCQRIKAKCEHAGDGTPCHRCRRLGIDASCEPPKWKHNDAASLAMAGSTLAAMAMPKPAAPTSKRAAAAQLAKAARMAVAVPAASRPPAVATKGRNGQPLAPASHEPPNGKRRRLVQPPLPPPPQSQQLLPPPPPQPSALEHHRAAALLRKQPPMLAMGPLQSQAIVHGVSADYSYAGGVPKGLIKYWLLFYTGCNNVPLLTRAVTLGAICGYHLSDVLGPGSESTQLEISRLLNRSPAEAEALQTRSPKALETILQRVQPLGHLPEGSLPRPIAWGLAAQFNELVHLDVTSNGEMVTYVNGLIETHVVSRADLAADYSAKGRTFRFVYPTFLRDFKHVLVRLWRAIDAAAAEPTSPASSTSAAAAAATGGLYFPPVNHSGAANTGPQQQHAHSGSSSSSASVSGVPMSSGGVGPGPGAVGSVSGPGTVGTVNNPGLEGSIPSVGSGTAPAVAAGGEGGKPGSGASAHAGGNSGSGPGSISSTVSGGGGYTVRSASEAVGPVLVWHRTAGPEGGWVACKGSYTLVVTTSPAGMVVHELTVVRPIECDNRDELEGSLDVLDVGDPFAPLEAEGEVPRDLWDSMGFVDGHDMQLVESMIADHLEQDTDAALQSDDLHSPQSAESLVGHGGPMSGSGNNSSAINMATSFDRGNGGSGGNGGVNGGAREDTRSRSQSRDLSAVLLSPVGLNSRDPGSSSATTSSGGGSSSSSTAESTVARGFC